MYDGNMFSPGTERGAAAWVTALAIVLGAGCGASSAHMYLLKPPRALVVPRDGAVVVFVRPSNYLKTEAFTIVDGRGRFLGESLPASHFAVRVPPGRHVFVVCRDGGGSLDATVAPGLVYYVEVAPTPRFDIVGAALGVREDSHRVDLVALKPGAAHWDKLPQWVAETEQYAADEAAGQADLYYDPPDGFDQCVARGNQDPTERSAEGPGAFTLEREDGVPAPGITPGSVE